MNYKKRMTSKTRKMASRNKKQKYTKKNYGFTPLKNSTKLPVMISNNAPLERPILNLHGYKGRLYGGDANIDPNTNTNMKLESNEIMDEVKKEREFNLAESPIIEKTGELAEGVAVKSIEGIGDFLGVDLSDTKNTGEKLEEIKEALADPKNQEKVKEIIGEAAQVGSVAIEAASPFIQPLVDKTIDVGSKALSKMSESAVKIGLNTAEEIPGVGVVIGSVRSLSNAGEAFLAGTNAVGEVVTASSDTINAATKNFQQLMKEKMSSINRINDSLGKFQQPFNSQRLMQSQMQPQMQSQMQSQMQPQPLSGGNTRKHKMKKYKKYTHKNRY